MKVRSSIESKPEYKGFFSKDFKEGTEPEDEFGLALEYMPLKKADIGYCLGSNGITRVKLCKASGAMLQYFEGWACIGGTKKQRTACRDYLHFLLSQRDDRKDGRTSMDIKGRTDVITINFDQETYGYLAHDKGRVMRRVEDDTDIVLFLIIA